MWLGILLIPLVLRSILFYCVSSCLGSSLSDYIDVSPIIVGFYRDPLDILVVLVHFFLDLPKKCRQSFVSDLLCNSTYMSLVRVDIPLHNFLVVGSCGTLMVLCLVQILIYLVLYLYIHIDLCMVHCTEVPGYTVRDYIVVVHYYTVVAHCHIVVSHCCMVVVHI
jgi:hypothetical protein